MANEKKKLSNISIEDAQLVFKNFSGKEGKFNPPGKRNFCVVLTPEIANDLRADGWNVKESQSRVEGDDPLLYLPIAVAFGDYPPKIILITSHGKTKIGEDEVNTLDWADIETADVIINPYQYEVNGRSGVKAYLKALYVTIREDQFESKYFDIPDTAENTIHCDHCTGCGDCQRAGEV